MDNTIDDKTDKLDKAKEQKRTADAGARLALGTIKNSERLKKWYFDYLLGDVTFASFTTALLAIIKIYFHLDWMQFWQGMLLFYTVLIATMLSRMTKRFCDKK